jgi:protein-L-isoaspartate(D-aspartate) O-methyltransferase
MRRLARGLIRAMGDDPALPGADPVAARGWMVERQLRPRGIADERVLAAMRAVPREAFVPAGARGAAHADEALPIEAGQTISQPFIVARMTELLHVGPGDRVLDIGTGSGYQAAVLAEMGCRVLSIERIPELAESARARLEALGYADRVEVRVGDGSLGDAAGAPWCGIVVAAAAPAIPPALREQLDPDGGRLVLPVGSAAHQELILVERRGDEWRETSDGPVMFVPLIGAEGFGEP